MNSQEMLTRARRFILEDLWRVDLTSRSLAATGVRTLQLCVIIGRGFMQDQLLLRASALTYVTTLSVIPLLAVMGAFVGIFDREQRFMQAMVQNLAAVSPEAQATIMELARTAKFGSLGTIGASVLVFTTVLALRHLESTLNDIWGILTSRTWMRRFADYLAVLIVAPILTAVSLSLATALQSEPIVGRMLEFPFFAMLYDAGLSWVPQIFLTVAFTFLYWFFPNTRVSPLSALLGGIVAALLFSAARYVYVDFSVGSARYSVLFGGFAAIPLVLAWIYICWAVVLLGAEVSFAHQNLSHFRRELRAAAPGPAAREAVGLAVITEVARAFRDHEEARSADSLAEDLRASVRTVRELLNVFDGAGLVALCGADDRTGGYMPGRPIEDIRVGDVLRAMRGHRRLARALPDDPEEEAEPEPAGPSALVCERVERTLDELERAVSRIADQRSLADILEATPRA